MARPTKYKVEYGKQLIAHARNGQSFQSFADKIDVSYETLCAWARDDNAKKYPGFSDAKKKARSAALAFWEKHYINATIKDKKSIDPNSGRFEYNTTLLIFAMKNMAGWSDKQEISDASPTKHITLNYKLDDSK